MTGEAAQQRSPDRRSAASDATSPDNWGDWSSYGATSKPWSEPSN